MRAVVLTATEHIEVTDTWPEPGPPGADEVVVAMRGVGLCGSDQAVVSGKIPTPSRPWVLGHEGGGEIVSVGASVADRHVGQRVVVEPNYCCFTCAFCRQGRPSACRKRRMVGINEAGLLAERVAVPARFAWPVPEGSPDELLACVEPLAVARSAVRRSGIARGDSALVIGAGSQGLLICQALIAVGVTPTVIEPHRGRRKLATELGACAAQPGDDAVEFVFNTTDAIEGWDVALDQTAPYGQLVMIGMSDTPVPLSTRHLVRRQLTIRGSLIYDHPHDFADTIDAVANGHLRPTDTVKRVYRPDEAAEAFAGSATVPGKSWISLAPWHDGNQS